MRYRALGAGGDSTFGSGRTAFLINNAAAVAQAILTRLLLMTGEWFLDLTEGTPYNTDILGKNTQATYDAAIRDRILGTQGVLSVDSYNSNLAGRVLTVNATVTTIYGPITIQTAFGPGVPPPVVITGPDGTIITGPGGEEISF